MRSEAALLRDFLSASSDMEEFTALGRADFMSSKLHQAAVMYKVQVVGEIVKQLSPELKLKYRHLPWAATVRYRNRLIHAFHRVDLQELWLNATAVIPRMAVTLR